MMTYYLYLTDIWKFSFPCIYTDMVFNYSYNQTLEIRSEKLYICIMKYENFIENMPYGLDYMTNV